MESTRHLWLLGLSGSGKSTVGARLARALGLPWVDTDSEICQDSGKSIPEIFQKEGEEAFREREAALVAKISSGKGAVVSGGGGIILRADNRKAIASSGIRIYLRSDPGTLARRLALAHDRPLLSGKSAEATLAQQLEQRTPWYEESEIQIDVTCLTPDEVVAAIRKNLPAPWSL